MSARARRESGAPHRPGRPAQTARRHPFGSAGVPAWVCLMVVLAGAACSEPTRYRVLTFFFDGVPKPGQTPPKGYVAPNPPELEDLRPSTEEPTGKGRTMYAHAPYRENRCGSCHNATTGELSRPPTQGLCTACHRELTAALRYVHGPVAVNECLLCHHAHGSAYPRLLLAEATALCLRCHERGDLTSGDHHAEVESASGDKCVECHNPHGGGDAFFLKRTGT